MCASTSFILLCQIIVCAWNYVFSATRSHSFITNDLFFLSVGAFQWRYDPYSGVQHEEGHERKRHHQGSVWVFLLNDTQIDSNCFDNDRIMKPAYLVTTCLHSCRSGISEGSRGSGACGSGTVGESMPLCEYLRLPFRSVNRARIYGELPNQQPPAYVN